jgi:hypothetical protein
MDGCDDAGILAIWTSNRNCTHKDERRTEKRGTECGTAVYLHPYVLSHKFSQPFEHGTTNQEGTVDILYSDIRRVFTHDAANVPLVILVHDEEMVRGVLARSGIDVGSFTSVTALFQRGQSQVACLSKSSGIDLNYTYRNYRAEGPPDHLPRDAARLIPHVTTNDARNTNLTMMSKLFL